MDKKELSRQLQETLVEIDTQIAEVFLLAEAVGIRPHAMRSTNGDFFLAPLLVAKTDLLSSMIDLIYG